MSIKIGRYIDKCWWRNKLPTWWRQRCHNTFIIWNWSTNNLFKCRIYRLFLTELHDEVVEKQLCNFFVEAKSLLATQMDRLYLFHEYLEHHWNIHSHLELFPVRHILAVRIKKCQRKLLKVTGIY